MTPKQLREENAELRDIIVRGVMSTSDQLKAATEAKVMAEYRRRQTEIALNVANTNRGYLDKALQIIVRLHGEGAAIPDEVWDAARTALNINGYWRANKKDQP